MALTSPEYLCFLAILFAVYWLAGARKAWLPAIVVAANVFFYWRWAPIYAAIVPAAATVDYFIAWAIHLSPEAGRRRLLMALSLTVNLGLIAVTRLSPGTWVISLSFYAFQALTGTIDVFRGDSRPSPSLLRHLASALFFPTTLAGPIARLSALIPQWDAVRAPLAEAEGGRALFLIGLGAAKKFLVADYLANNLVERVFDTPKLYSAVEVLAGVYGYAFQLYYDFSGYTDIAIGSALLLGIKLPANFNRPYEAANIAEFWRRWHITLSNWLRDYLFFSLPGQRTKAGPYLGLILTMVLGGLWHGFAWTFVIWGGLHGLGLAVTRGFQALRGRRAPSAAGRVVAAVATFHFVAFCWIFFRAAQPAAALDMLGQLASGSTEAANVTAGFAVVLAVAAVFHYLPRAVYDLAQRSFVAAPAPVQALTLLALTAGIQYTGSTGAAPFLYQKF